MSTEFIEFQDRAKLNEMVVRLRDDKDVLSIDVIENGKTLRVVRESDATTEVPEGEDAPGEAEGEQGDPGTGEEPGDSEEGSDEAEDLLGEVDADPKAAKPEITPETDRNTLREIVKQYHLDVDIPNAGPLQPLRDRIEAALAEKE